MAAKQTLPRLFSSPFSKRGFEQTVPNFSFKECSRINRDAGRFCRLSLVGTAPVDPYGRASLAVTGSVTSRTIFVAAGENQIGSA
jgi:hypothetical protein